jgi:hypothetical protein
MVKGVNLNKFGNTVTVYEGEIGFDQRWIDGNVHEAGLSVVIVYENEFRIAILAVWYRIIAEFTLASLVTI